MLSRQQIQSQETGVRALLLFTGQASSGAIAFRGLPWATGKKGPEAAPCHKELSTPGTSKLEKGRPVEGLGPNGNGLRYQRLWRNQRMEGRSREVDFIQIRKI